MTATEHSNLFCVYKNIIVCKVPVMKQHNRYSDTGKNATIICVVNGLALSMVTVFEDIFLFLHITSLNLSHLTLNIANLSVKKSIGI